MICKLYSWRGRNVNNFGFIRWQASVAMLGILLAGIFLEAAGKKEAPQSPRSNPRATGLIWPLPPDLPRVRWLAEYTDMSRTKKPAAKKRGLLERFAGSQSAEDNRLELMKPYGITTDSLGRIYAADIALRTIFVIDPATQNVRRIESSSRAPMVLPVGVATDSEDRLFVSDAQLHSITCFNSTGNPVARFGANSLGRPGGIAVDRQRNRLFVADAKENRIAVFDIKQFGLVGYIGAPGKGSTREKRNFAGPTNVAVDRDGNVYVADTLNCRVQIFNPAGRFLRMFGTQGDRPGEFIRPKGIALDSEGHVYVADAEFNNFQIFSQDGQPLLAVGVLGSAPGEFGLIAGMHIDHSDRIYTTEMYIGRIQVFQYIAQPLSADRKGGD